MSDKLPPDVPEEISNTLTWLSRAYDLSLEGFPGLEGGISLAAKAKGATPRERARQIVHWACLKAGCVGFATNLGGLFTLPISLPANLAGTAMIQIAMVQSVAILAGYDPKDERVKWMVLLAALGMGVTEIVKGLGVSIAKALTEQLVKEVMAQALAKLLARKALTVIASKSIFRWSAKIIPVVGGVVAAAIDAGASKLIGETAISMFMPEDEKAP
jgi:uncharacterized protein (DUF697 family)